MKKPQQRMMRSASAVTAVVTVLVLAGCTSGSPSTTTADGRTVLKVYGWKGGEGEPANVAEINTAFEKANPDIELEFEAIPANEAYSQRVQPELLAGNAADVIMLDSNLLATWGKSGYLADLSSASWADDITPEVESFATYDGDVLAMPMEAIGVGLYSNTELLSEVGVTEVPKDWDGFVDALAKLRAAGHVPITLPDKAGWTGAMALLNAAATTVDEDWDEEFYRGDASFSDWKPAVEQLLDLQEQGLIDWKTELGEDEWSQGVDDFTAGDTGFWLQGAWNLGGVAEAGVDSRFTAWPGGTSGVDPNELLFVGTMWGVNEASPVKEAAEKYVDFWSQPENLDLFLEAENAISPFTSGTSPQTDATAEFLASYQAGNYRFMQTNTWMAGDVQTQMGSRLQALFLDEITVDEFLDEMDGIAKKAD
ncbi:MULTISPECIES: ABC transporter substrate-binding protein [unclassified Microbacterium]|uniref:ABC transporter substrate-binding protein n=1 Tax=unclassified Microbacterium TaxID=2609290 RepID=UPI00109D0E1B|nr:MULTISPECIES: ABC transporter substrate-binding protein [unclassified Microbacterium]